MIINHISETPVIKWKAMKIRNETLFHRKIIKNNNINIPHFSKKFSIYLYLGDKNENKIFEPSSGGIGIRLNKTRTKFKITIIEAIFKKGPIKEALIINGENLISNPKIIAINKLAKTPATETSIVPFLTLRRLFGLYGTGLAQPITKPALDKTRSKGRTKEPNMSRCFIGFRVRRPLRRAVLSPRR